MSEEKNSYRQILKATSIYGGVQLFTILISIIRNKTVALWLGPSGMGLFAIFTSTVAFISSLSNFGLSTSGIKNIASSYASGDTYEFGKTVKVFRFLILFTGWVGFLVTLILCGFLSKLNFDSYGYTWSFALLSVTILLNQIAQGKLVILQGIQKTKLLAGATLLGAIIGLLINLPLFYFYREKGIVGSILTASVVSLILAYICSRNLKIEKVELSTKAVKKEGAEILKMGFLISLTSILTQLIFYVIRLFILKKGSIIDLGFYNAGFALISTYFGMVLTAMGTDYYPRLSKVIENKAETFREMNNQAEIAVLIIAPLLCFFLVYINFGIRILYSKEFLASVPMLRWAVVGVFFQVCSWSMAYIFLAKGDSKQYFWNEIITLCYFLILNVLGYLFMGLKGLGIAFLVQYFIYTLHMYFVVKTKYGFSTEKKTLKLISLQLLCVSLCLVVTLNSNLYLVYFVGTFFAAISSIYSFIELDRRIGLKKMILARIKK